MKIPKLYKRGVIILFTNCSLSTVTEICGLHGLDVDGEYFGGYIIKTEVGKEVKTANFLTIKYPKIFDSYERLDMMWDNVNKTIDDVNTLTSLIHDEYGRMNGNVENVNKLIDSSIKKLKSLKI